MHIRVSKKYYPQTLLKECKYETKKNRMENLINVDLEPSSFDESDSGFYSGPDSDESNN